MKAIFYHRHLTPGEVVDEVEEAERARLMLPAWRGISPCGQRTHGRCPGHEVTIELGAVRSAEKQLDLL